MGDLSSGFDDVVKMVLPHSRRLWGYDHLTLINFDHDIRIKYIYF